MLVRVKPTTGGRPFEVELEPEDPVETMKVLILVEKSDLDVDLGSMTLIHKGQRMCDDAKAIKEYGVAPGSFVVLQIKRKTEYFDQSGYASGTQPSVDTHAPAAAPGTGPEPAALAAPCTHDAPVEEPPVVIERKAYDADMQRYLLQHTIPPRKVKHVIEDAAIMRARLPIVKARAQFAHKLMARHRDAEEDDEEAGDSSVDLKPTLGQKLLQQRLDFFRLKLMQMQDDGDCQFRSLAHELFGDQERHRDVRDKVIAHLWTNSDQYSSLFIGGESEWTAYLEGMSVPNTRGDELTLRAACECYKCVMNVITTEREQWLLSYSAMKDGNEDTPPEGTRVCFLTYVPPMHYSVIELPSQHTRDHDDEDDESDATDPDMPTLIPATPPEDKDFARIIDGQDEEDVLQTL